MQNSGHTILYVEDDYITRTNISTVLQKVCKKVLVAEDGLEAYEQYCTNQPDIIITDIRMPKMDGIELVKKIRQINTEVPIIVMSAYSDKENLLEAIELNVSDYIIKPVTREILKQSVEKSLKKIEQYYTKAYDTLFESILILGLDFQVQYANKAFFDMSLYRDINELDLKTLRSFFPYSDIENLFQSTQEEQNILFMRKDGTKLFVKIRVRKLVLNMQEVFLVSMIDISEIVKEASKDALTGLETKYTLKHRFDNLISENNFKNYGAIFVDIDNFKVINDTLGHQFGDKVIQKISSILVQGIRKDDMIFRWGGDEFLVLLSDATIVDTLRIAEILRKRINELEFEDYSDFSCSFGVDVIKSNDTIENVISRVDKALLEAKKFSKNCVVQYGN